MVKQMLEFFDIFNTGVVNQYKSEVDNARKSNRFAGVLEDEPSGRKDYMRDDYIDHLQGGAFGVFAYDKKLDGLLEELDKDPTQAMLKLDVPTAVTEFKEMVSKGILKGVPGAEAILKDPNWFKLESYTELLGDMEKITKDNAEIARKELANSIDLRNSAYVDKPWYNLTENDIDVDIFSNEQYSALNKKLASLALESTSAGVVSKEQFLENLRNDKTKISGNQTAWDMIKDIEVARHEGQSGVMTPGGWASAEPKRAGIGSMLATAGSAALSVGRGLFGATAGLGYNDLMSSGEVPSITDIIYDKYKAVWDTKKNSNIFKSFYPKTGIPGASGADLQIDASTYNGINILPDAYGTPHRNLWTQTMGDVNRINWSDTDNNKISLSGANKTTANEIDRGLQIINALDGLIKKGGDTALGMRVFAGQVANNDPTKGAMVIIPTYKQLQELGLVRSTSDEDQKLLSQAEANLIAQKGISVISNRNNFQNWLFKDSEITPGEARINAAGPNGITYEDPFGNGHFTTRPILQNNATIGFTISGKIRQLDPNTGREEWQDLYVPNISMGGTVDNAMLGMKQNLINLTEQNDKIFRQFNPKK